MVKKPTWVNVISNINKETRKNTTSKPIVKTWSVYFVFADWTEWRNSILASFCLAKTKNMSVYNSSILKGYKWRFITG